MNKILLTLAAVLLTACDNYMDDGNTENTIIFHASDRAADSNITATRGTLVTASSDITPFGVCAAAYPVAGSHTTASCGSMFYKLLAQPDEATGYYWPTSDYRMAFYAYYPYGHPAFTLPVTPSTGTPAYAYTVPSVIAQQADIMTAQHTSVNPAGQSTFTLAFQHECAGVQLVFANNHGQAVTLTSVAIEGVRYSGTLKDHSWALSNAVNSSLTNPFVLTVGSTIDAGASLELTATNKLIMLPQVIPSGAVIKAVIDGNTYETVLSGTWQAGKLYTYTLSVSTSYDLSIIDWDQQDITSVINTVNDWGDPTLVTPQVNNTPVTADDWD